MKTTERKFVSPSIPSQAACPAFSGLENALFFGENTRMLYGDAKATVTAVVAQFGK